MTNDHEIRRLLAGASLPPVPEADEAFVSQVASRIRRRRQSWVVAQAIGGLAVLVAVWLAAPTLSFSVVHLSESFEQLLDPLASLMFSRSASVVGPLAAGLWALSRVLGVAD